MFQYRLVSSLSHSLNPGAVISRLLPLGTFSCRRGVDCVITPSEVPGENNALLYIMKLLTGPKKTNQKHPHLVMALKRCTESDETRLLLIAIITQLRNVCLGEIIEQSGCFTSRQCLLVTSVLVPLVWGTNENAADKLCQLKYFTQLIKIGPKSQSESMSSGRSFL